MRLVIAALMMLEGLASGLRFARFVSILVIYPPLTAILLTVRAVIGASLFSSGLMLIQRRPVGLVLGPAALITSAAFGIAEIGFALVPTSILPVYRWPAAALYCVYACGAAWWLRRQLAISD